MELLVDIRLLFNVFSSPNEPNYILWPNNFLVLYLFYLLLFPSSNFIFYYLGNINTPNEHNTPNIPTDMKNIYASIYPFPFSCY